MYHRIRNMSEAYFQRFKSGLICICALCMLNASGCSGGDSDEEDGGDSEMSSESSDDTITGSDLDSDTVTDPIVDSESETSDASVDTDPDTEPNTSVIWAASCAGGGEDTIEDTTAGAPSGKMWLTIGSPALGPEPAENLPYAKMYWGFGNAANEFSDF